MSGKYGGNKVKRKKGKGNKNMNSPAKQEQRTDITLNGGSPINHIASSPEVQHVDLQQCKDNQLLLKLETLASECVHMKVTIQNIETSKLNGFETNLTELQNDLAAIHSEVSNPKRVQSSSHENSLRV